MEEIQASVASTLPSAVPVASAKEPAPLAAPAVPVAATAPIPAPEALAAPAVREDQVQNAVGFLSHPQVRGSSNTASKRSFLERKGLTIAEIEEAFRRVPEAPPSPASAPVTPPHVASTPGPPPAPLPAAYALQPAAQPYATAANPAASQLIVAQPAASTALVPQVPPAYRWSQIVLGVGTIFAAGWAVQQLVLPRLRAMLESWQAQRREAEDVRHKELHAAVASLKGCQEELKISTQALLEAVTLMREQQRGASVDGALPTRGTVGAGRPVGAPSARDNYYQTINGRANMPYGGGGGNGNLMSADNYSPLRAGAGYTNVYPPDPPSYTVSYNYGRGDNSGPAAAGPTGGDGSRSGAATMYGTPYGAVRSAAANPYGGAGQQQQENLPYRVTAPPSPAHSTHFLQSGRQPQQQATGGLGSASGPYGSGDRLYEQSMPEGGEGEGAGQGPKASSATAAVAGGSSATGADGRTVPRPPPEQPVYPQSFHDVMEMVQRGLTPPNVRTDINDAPPDPTRPFSEAQMPAPLKPWERMAAAAAPAASGSSFPSGSSSSGPMASSAAARAGIPCSWGLGPQADPTSMLTSTPLQLPATTYGAPSSAVMVGGTGDASGSASRNGASGTGLSVLPPANPGWRPPPPPVRTVVSSKPASPPSSSSTGMASGSGSGYVEAAAAALGPSAGAAAAAAPSVLAAVGPEPAAALAGPPSPSPSQPAFAATATELMPSLDGLPSDAALAAAAPPFSSPTAGFPLSRPPPPPPLPAALQVAEVPADAPPSATDVATPSPSAAPSMNTP